MKYFLYEHEWDWVKGEFNLTDEEMEHKFILIKKEVGEWISNLK